MAESSSLPLIKPMKVLSMKAMLSLTFSAVPMEQMLYSVRRALALKPSILPMI